MFCSNCGQELEDTAFQYCPNCGAPIGTPEILTTTPTTTQSIPPPEYASQPQVSELPKKVKGLGIATAVLSLFRGTTTGINLLMMSYYLLYSISLLVAIIHIVLIIIGAIMILNGKIQGGIIVAIGFLIHLLELIVEIIIFIPISIGVLPSTIGVLIFDVVVVVLAIVYYNQAKNTY